ncbi:MAG TPA: DUF1018 domain-containing protein [Blastocatellia bacterium]|nr:DUF1018 domain-containing protein [Blastocatellia bacterium]HMV81791.1 DUF1018 domain-containing protein [Blastocatellia bacterium]HMX24729.1 DUF1018 domain-containing protein [Blastocatellia bacterium]HMY70690.1 DUF1018 domain-containing protein [Blastocatellia bacterium]HMZ16479.1 DUF1018 domain-containing protein [Blastocatellia bacterium]
MATVFTPAVPAGTKTKAQVRELWARARQRGLDDEGLHNLVKAETGSDSIRGLSKSQADKVIAALGGVPHQRKRSRTSQHRRQKAGVKQIVTQEQLDLMKFLAGELDWKNESLNKFCQRQIKRDQPSTTAEANKVIEGMKAILKRRPE